MALAGFIAINLIRLLKNVMSTGKTRQNPTKKPSLYEINEHFEEDFNAVWPSAIVYQRPVKDTVILLAHQIWIT
jgi:hypothetical protein